MKVNKKLMSFLLLGVMAVMTCSAVPASAAPDPDGDGKIGINDAVLIMQYLVGKFEPTSASLMSTKTALSAKWTHTMPSSMKQVHCIKG